MIGILCVLLYALGAISYGVGLATLRNNEGYPGLLLADRLVIYLWPLAAVVLLTEEVTRMVKGEKYNG